MKNKSILRIFLIFTLLFTLTIPVAATQTVTIQLEPFNEYNFVKTLQNSSLQELENLGISEREATTIISNYESALLERALLSDSELSAYGYNNSEISLFHDLANGQELSSAEMQSLGSTCTGSITRHSVSTKTAEFSYTFTWDRCPIITLSDSAAIKWLAYDDYGQEIGVEYTSRTMVVEYHFKGNAASDGKPAFAHYGNPTCEEGLSFNTLNMQFPVYQPHTSDNGLIFDCYARTGTVQVSVKVPTGTPQNIHHIFVSGLYGHTTLGIGPPSVTPNGKLLDISFTGNTLIDPIASRKATIYRTSTNVEYWAE